MISNRTLLIGSIALFATVTAMDLITTMVALNIGAHELNPFMVSVVSNPGLFLLAKLTAIGLLAYLGWSIEQRCEGAGVIALTVASAVTVMAVSNNFNVIIDLI